MGDLTVTYRPIQNEREQAAYEAALDTLIEMVLRKIKDQREMKAALDRGQESILQTLSESVKE